MAALWTGTRERGFQPLPKREETRMDKSEFTTYRRRRITVTYDQFKEQVTLVSELRNRLAREAEVLADMVKQLQDAL